MEDPGVNAIDAVSKVTQQAAERLTDASQGPAVATTHLKAVGSARYILISHAQRPPPDVIPPCF